MLPFWDAPFCRGRVLRRFLSAYKRCGPLGQGAMPLRVPSSHSSSRTPCANLNPCVSVHARSHPSLLELATPSVRSPLKSGVTRVGLQRQCSSVQLMRRTDHGRLYECHLDQCHRRACRRHAQPPARPVALLDARARRRRPPHRAWSPNNRASARGSRRGVRPAGSTARRVDTRSTARRVTSG